MAEGTARVKRSGTHRSGRLIGCCATLAIGLSACGVSGLAFRTDTRVGIVEPHDRTTVDLPVTVRWTAEDDLFDPDGGSFGVLVDRAPPPPGKTLAWLFRGDDECAGAPGCPTAAYMEERRVHETTALSFTVERVTFSQDTERRMFHEVTLILLDEHGRRLGEAAWFVQFEVRGEG